MRFESFKRKKEDEKANVGEGVKEYQNRSHEDELERAGERLADFYDFSEKENIYESNMKRLDGLGYQDTERLNNRIIQELAAGNPVEVHNRNWNYNIDTYTTYSPNSTDTFVHEINNQDDYDTWGVEEDGVALQDKAKKLLEGIRSIETIPEKLDQISDLLDRAEENIENNYVRNLDEAREELKKLLVHERAKDEIYTDNSEASNMHFEEAVIAVREDLMNLVNTKTDIEYKNDYEGGSNSWVQYRILNGIEISKKTGGSLSQIEKNSYLYGKEVNERDYEKFGEIVNNLDTGSFQSELMNLKRIVNVELGLDEPKNGAILGMKKMNTIKEFENEIKRLYQGKGDELLKEVLEKAIEDAKEFISSKR